MKRYVLITTSLVATALLFVTSHTHAQQPAQPGTAASARSTSSSTWRLTLSRVGPQTYVTLRARDSSVAEIAAKLSKELKVPITLSDLMKRQVITVKLFNQPLETALLMLSPQAWVEHEIGGPPGTPPKLVAVYLQAYNESPPLVNLGRHNKIVVFEGNTEDGVETTEAGVSTPSPPLSVNFQEDRLSVTARHQTLLAVLSEIAGRLDCDLSVRHMSDETVDLNFRDVALEDVPRMISPYVFIRLRTDLSTQSKVALQVILDAQPEHGGKPVPTIGN